MDHISQVVQFRCIVIFIIGNEPPSILAENEYVHYKKIDFLIRLGQIFDQLCYPRLS